MQFMLMLYAEEKAGAAIPKAQMDRVMDSLYAYQAALTKAGAFIATAPLAPTAQAKTLRMEGGEIRVSSASRSEKPEDAEPVFVREGGELKVHDGPYAETKEQFGGYYIIEAEDMDAALHWAARCPAAQWGPIEVRPFATFS